jgi:hypothetical protein
VILKLFFDFFSFIRAVQLVRRFFAQLHRIHFELLLWILTTHIDALSPRPAFRAWASPLSASRILVLIKNKKSNDQRFVLAS